MSNTNPIEHALDDAIAPHLPGFFSRADAIVQAGLAFARSDDANRFSALHREFDSGRGVPCLVVEGFGTDEQRIAVRLVGAVNGAERVVELFAVNVRATGSPEH